MFIAFYNKQYSTPQGSYTLTKLIFYKQYNPAGIEINVILFKIGEGRKKNVRNPHRLPEAHTVLNI